MAAFDARVLYKVGGTEQNPGVVAELAIGEASFWVSDEAPEYGNHSPESLGGCTVRLLLRVDEPELVHARAVRLGAVDLAPVQQSHGWLIGRIADPFGHHWEIRETTASVAAADGPR